MCTTPTLVSGSDGRSATLPVVTAGLDEAADVDEGAAASRALAGALAVAEGILGATAAFFGAAADGPFGLGNGGDTDSGPAAAGSGDDGGSNAADAPDDAPRDDEAGLDCCATPLAAGASASTVASSNRAQVMVIRRPVELSAFRISAPSAPHTCVRGMSQ